MELSSQYLHVYHYLNPKNTTAVELKRDIVDFEKECDFDLTCLFIDEVALNDADNDNTGEFTFAYRLACRSDVSPSTMKAITIENGDKYIVRGTSSAMGYGGEYKVGEELSSAPEAFTSILTSFYERNVVEF